IWLECSGAYDIRQPGYYRRLLDTHTDEVSSFMTQIELDVHRTMPDNIFFGGDGPGVCKLRRVLTAYSWHNPAIGYCQGMNVMAATLLLVFPTSEENAFWTLVYLLEHIIPEGYHSHQLMAAQADQRVLEELCRDTAPQLAGHLKACGVDMAAITISWFLSIFAESMPLEALLRVWDMVLVEGFLALFRISVALLHLHERDMLSLHSTTALYVYLK
ncbi:rab-GTPase-TBC domain-containing protein, partial [Syncephalis pseudoplumigaleata]